jgi:hypothetical protein
MMGRGSPTIRALEPSPPTSRRHSGKRLYFREGSLRTRRRRRFRGKDLDLARERYKEVVSQAQSQNSFIHAEVTP